MGARRASDTTSATEGMPFAALQAALNRCGVPSFPHKVLRPCGDPRNLLYRRALRKGLNLQNDPADRFAKRGNPAREGSPLLAGFTDYPFTEQVKTVYWRSVMVIDCCRLSAGRSLTKGSDLYAYPAGTSFCSCKRKQNTLGETPRPPTLGCAGYGYYFSAAAEKQIRTARRCAPKVACGGIFIARALEREGRTTSPLPSSKEGNYGAGEQILWGC